MTTSFSRLAWLLAVTACLGIARAELKDGDNVPNAPAKEADRYKWTITGVERYHLPTLDKGVGKGFFAVHEERGVYRAFVTEDGALEVELLSRSGEVQGSRFTLGGAIAGYYTIKNNQGRPQNVPRYLVGVDGDPKPNAQARDSVEILATLEEGVKFRRVYEFGRDEIIVMTGMKCPNTKKSYGGMGATFPAIMRFENSVPQADREKALKGFEVKIRHVAGRKKDTKTYSYADSVTWSGVCDEAQIAGPWGRDRTLTIKTKEPIMRPHIYTGYCPYQGYSFGITVREGSLYNQDFKLAIQFDN